MACYIGIDIGTSSTKSLILRSDGKILGTAQAKYDVLRPVLGYSEQNVDDLWRAVKCTLGELAVKFPDAVSQVECIGFSGQMHALVMLDEHNEPLRNAMIWEDQRSLQEVKEILSTVTEEAYCRTTLNKLSTGFLLSSLIWVRNNEPDTFRQIKTLTMIKDYIRYKLSGSIACDTTDAASSGVFDVANRTWAWNIIHALGLPPSIFPQCHEPYEIAGTLLDSVAEEIGLPKGIPMVYGGGDTLMHLVGTGVVSESCPWVSNIGTSCQVTCGTNHPIFDDQYRTNTFCHASQNLWMLMACNLCGGAALKWLSEKIVPGCSFGDLNAMASQVPNGSDGLIFLPFLSGSRLPENNPLAKGMFMGLTLNHTQKHLVRATMEGVIYSQKYAYNVLSQVTKNKPEYIISAGGGARSELLLQMQADMYDRPVRTTVQAEQSCIGAAITAALGLGHFGSYQEACEQLVHFNSRVIEPIQANVAKYNEGFQIYKELYPQNKKLFDLYDC